jgi:hypothetical protein
MGRFGGRRTEVWPFKQQDVAGVSLGPWVQEPGWGQRVQQELGKLQLPRAGCHQRTAPGAAPYSLLQVHL